MNGPTSKLIERFLQGTESCRIGVLGDFMLDHYIVGDVQRISPEAPVPVLRVTSETYGLGGAGNVAQNLSSLGANVECFGLIGADAQGQMILEVLKEKKVQSQLVQTLHFKTVTKSRVVARKQQIVRFDRDPAPLFQMPADLQDYILQRLDQHLPSIDALIVSDYAKGLLSPRFLEQLWSLVKQHEVPTWVDPKLPDYRAYRGCTAITPNAKEATLATGIIVDSDSSAESAAEALQSLTDADVVVITRGEQGLTLLDRSQDRVEHIPALTQEVYDVTGAGDTVIAVLAMAACAGMTSLESGLLANLAASVVVSHFGAVPCTRQDLLAHTTPAP